MRWQSTTRTLITNPKLNHFFLTFYIFLPILNLFSLDKHWEEEGTGKKRKVSKQTKSIFYIHDPIYIQYILSLSLSTNLPVHQVPGFFLSWTRKTGLHVFLAMCVSFYLLKLFIRRDSFRIQDSYQEITNAFVSTTHEIVLNLKIPCFYGILIFPNS